MYVLYVIFGILNILILNLEDPKTIADFIDMLLMNQRETYFLDMKQIKVRLSHRFRLFIFTRLFIRVTSFTLKQMYDQYCLITTASTTLSICTQMFTTMIEISCSHKIQNRMYKQERNELIRLKDVHVH